MFTVICINEECRVVGQPVACPDEQKAKEEMDRDIRNTVDMLEGEGHSTKLHENERAPWLEYGGEYAYHWEIVEIKTPGGE